jgi:hypothetical protein
MPTTANYGWTIPADTDLVKNGAAAIRTLGNAIDTTAAASFGSDLTLITRNSFSNVATVDVDSVFTTTYKTYLIVFEIVNAATGTDDLHFQLRYGTTTQTASYYCSTAVSNHSSSTFTNVNSNNASQYTMASNTENFAGYMYITGVGNTSEYPRFFGNANDFAQSLTLTLGGNVRTTQTYTGFRLKSSSTNITGTVAVYGLAI